MKSKPVTLCLEETDLCAGERGRRTAQQGRRQVTSLKPSAFPLSMEVRFRGCFLSLFCTIPAWALISCVQVAAKPLS